MSASRKDTELGSPEAAALWRRARPQAGPAAMAGALAPDALTIAAYIDGTLEAQERDRVEAWMAASPEALALIVAGRSAGTLPTPPAPAGLLVRARGLVGGRAAAASPASSGVLAWFAGLTQPGVWATAAAAMLLAAVVGFELGREATISLALASPAQAEDSIDIGPSTDDFL